ncbi:TSC22 domain family protein 2-like [Ambystoma mexicanum]|uniref:TSC22 domain family protein 2-like n=1 Tax=Ambystoma mexicanum TaxID=8296 RepID=UPI0037E88E3F
MGPAQSLVNGVMESTALKVLTIPEPQICLSTSGTPVCPPTTLDSSITQSTALQSSLTHVFSINEQLLCQPVTQEPSPCTWSEPKTSTSLSSANETASVCMSSASDYPLACQFSATVTHPVNSPSAMEPPVAHPECLSSVSEPTASLASVHERPVSCSASLPISEVHLSALFDHVADSSTSELPPKSQPFITDERPICPSYASGGSPEGLPFTQANSPNCLTVELAPPAYATSESETSAKNIKLVHNSGGPYMQGRWTCLEFYKRETDTIRHGLDIEQVANQGNGLDGSHLGAGLDQPLDSSFVAGSHMSLKEGTGTAPQLLHHSGASSQREDMTAAVQDVPVIAPAASVPDVPSTASTTPIGMPNVPAVVSHVQATRWLYD